MKKIFLNHSPKVVALVGMGPSIVDIFNETLTQECSTQWCDEVWAINMVSNIVEHDMVIWMDDLEQQQNFKPGLFDLLRRRGKPVLTSIARRDIVPTSYDYPLDEVAAISIPIFGKPYLGNGVAMGIAYALYKGVEVLKIYGCDFTYPNRNFAEEGRACTEAWITLASMRGMRIHLCPSTSLFDTTGDKGIYGYAKQPEITLPDSTKFKYVERAPGQGSYVATDSSGATNGKLSTLLPRVAGQRDEPHAEQRGSGDQRGAVLEPAAASTPEPGAGVEDQSGLRRPEAGHHAGLNGGSPPGGVPASA